MKKKIVLFQILYYILSMLIYVGFFYSIVFLLNVSKEKVDLGTAMAVTYFFLFIGTPMVVAVLMRFSLFKWYFDPFAAAETPFLLYIAMIMSRMRFSDNFYSAFCLVNRDLSDDGGMGWLFLLSLFAFGFLFSFSFARKKGESIAYRLISKNKQKE